jgi:hypothetical protein
MNYLTNYYKNLSEQLQAKVNYLQSLMEEQTPNKKEMKLSIIDRVSGSASSDSGIGAQYIAMGEDGKHYSFRSDAQWAYDNEDPSKDAPKTYEVHTGNPKHEIQDLRAINWNDKHDAHEFNNYRPRLNEANIRPPSLQFDAGLHRDKPTGWQNRRADQTPTNSYVPRYGAGLLRMNDMLHYQAAHAIAEPHEKEAIEALLTDMANTTNSTPGTAANMGHMRTAIGAVKRLKGTEAFAKSLEATRAPIERGAMNQASERIKRGQEDIQVDSDTLRNTYTDDYAAEQYDDAFHDVAQQRILGSRKKR